MTLFAQIAAPFVCVAPLLVAFAFERWIARADDGEVDE